MNLNPATRTPQACRSVFPLNAGPVVPWLGTILCLLPSVSAADFHLASPLSPLSEWESMGAGPAIDFRGAQLNLVLAWLWIVVGFGVGFFFGLNFHKEQWLGGYASFKRRLYRLAHISFFGLAIVNFLFYSTARTFGRPSTIAVIASWGFVVGAVSMPICCLIMAHRPRLRALFLIPVLSLLAAGTLTLWEVTKL